MFRVSLCVAVRDAPRDLASAPPGVPQLFTFRFNRRFWPMGAFNAMLGIATRVKAPTCAALYDGRWVHPAVVRVPEPGAVGQPDRHGFLHMDF